MNWFDLPAYIDPIERVEGALSTFINADWVGAFRRDGFAGVLSEFSACVFSENAPTIRVARGSHWSGMDIERLLARHGVKVWDRGIAGDDLYFCVKRRQVVWAEYLLLRAGVPVTSPLVDPRNAEYAERYPPGSEPPARQAQPDWLEQILAWLR
ncbi:MAG: hypothetical protein HY868_10035 [Chloroflexi bacterium]|nr:hypothetical protein [Chloroflexota bacterium]